MIGIQIKGIVEPLKKNPLRQPPLFIYLFMVSVT